jgi:hypothetical protein
MLLEGGVKVGDKVCHYKTPTISMLVKSFDDFSNKAVCTWLRAGSPRSDVFSYSELSHYRARVSDNAIRPLRK